MLEGALARNRDVAARDTGVVLPHHVLVLIAALAAAAVAQGGYYPPGRALSAGLLGVALLLASRARPWSGMWPMLLAGTGFIGWAVLRGILAGGLASAIPTVLAVGCLVGAAIVARQAGTAERELCASVAVGIGVLVAATGWIAVVARIPSWSTVSSGLIRASATLTYPNATAALLAALALLSIAWQLSRPGPVPAGATYLLLIGLGATLSRAGMLAFLVGLVVLALLAGIRRTLREIAAPVLGAIVGIAALAPSFPITATNRPVLAVAGLVAGGAIAVGLTRLPARVRTPALLGGLALAGAALVAIIGASQQIQSRVALDSPDRGRATDAALDLVAAHPLTGVGPGRAWLYWTTPDGHGRVIRFVHNEYLQVLLELGAIGLGLLLCLLAAVAVILKRGRTSRPLWAGAVAGLAALIVHSGFDFLWHLPVIVLTAGLLIGLAGPKAKERQ